MRKFWSAIIIINFALLVSCATHKPLYTRGLSADERRYFVVQNGYGITKDVKSAFLEGVPAVGMTQDMVHQLYGPPDRALENDMLWEYLASRGVMMTGFKFKEGKVIEILGDKRGGLPLESQE